MSNHTRELLNYLYQPLEKRAHEFTAMLAGLHGGFKISSGFFNRHYHKMPPAFIRQTPIRSRSSA